MTPQRARRLCPAGGLAGLCGITGPGAIPFMPWSSALASPSGSRSWHPWQGTCRGGAGRDKAHVTRGGGVGRGRGGGSVGQVTASRFVVQLHDATTLHFDLRVRAGGALRSWAVPRGPSLDPAVRRLAVPVEDHTLEAGEFEGVHPDARRGSGAVIIWDEGPAEVTRDEPGHLSFVAHGSKLAGGFALTRTGPRRWVLVKVRDEHARPGSDIAAQRPASVRSGRTWQDLAERGG
jgi:DNA ligase D-like protein (predicted 3'-phosphoesterase)